MGAMLPCDKSVIQLYFNRKLRVFQAFGQSVALGSMLRIKKAGTNARLSPYAFDFYFSSI